MKLTPTWVGKITQIEKTNHSPEWLFLLLNKSSIAISATKTL
ncbi:MAG: hypothetical protein AAFY71_13885 [Bacteroidota bacterium]